MTFAYVSTLYFSHILSAESSPFPVPPARFPCMCACACACEYMRVAQ